MTASVTVRRAVTPPGCALVRPLAVAHARYERSDAEVPPDWGDRVAGLIAAGRLDLFVASDGGAAIGYASVTTEVSTWTAGRYAHLDCLFVAEARRDAGVGRQLVGAVVDHARAQGLAELRWQTPTWNEDAVRFYRRLGAVESPKVRFTLGTGLG